MLGPLKTPIQSEAITEVSESDFDSKTLETASHQIGAGPNMCTQRFSCVLSLACDQIFRPCFAYAVCSVTVCKGS